MACFRIAGTAKIVSTVQPMYVDILEKRCNCELSTSPVNHHGIHGERLFSELPLATPTSGLCEQRLVVERLARWTIRPPFTIDMEQPVDTDLTLIT